MSHVHEPRTTVVEERSGVSALAILLIVLIAGLLIAFLAFSGVFSGNDVDDPDRTVIQNKEENTVINPPADTSDNTTTDNNTTQPQPSP